MTRTAALALALCAAAAIARGDEPPTVAPTVAPTVDAAAGARAFATVARVLQSPRCQNCHPAGDRPLQGDRGRPHRMNISRTSVAAGLTTSRPTPIGSASSAARRARRTGACRRPRPR